MNNPIRRLTILDIMRMIDLKITALEIDLKAITDDNITREKDAQRIVLQDLKTEIYKKHQEGIRL